MDVRLTNDSTEVIVDGKVVKSVESDRKKMGANITELVGDDNVMLEALRFCHRKMKVVSTTFKGVK